MPDSRHAESPFATQALRHLASIAPSEPQSQIAVDDAQGAAATHVASYLGAISHELSDDGTEMQRDVEPPSCPVCHQPMKGPKGGAVCAPSGGGVAAAPGVAPAPSPAPAAVRPISRQLTSRGSTRQLSSRGSATAQLLLEGGVITLAGEPAATASAAKPARKGQVLVVCGPCDHLGAGSLCHRACYDLWLKQHRLVRRPSRKTSDITARRDLLPWKPAGRPP